MKIIIAGCGRLGSGLAVGLSKSGHDITVISDDPSEFERLDLSFKGKTIVGVEFDRDVLLKAGIEKADALAAVTTSDETNVVIARLASLIFRVPKVVSRVFDQQKAELYQRLGQQTVDPTTWSVHRVSEMLSYSPLDKTLSFGSGEVEMVETEVPALLVGRKVIELMVPGEISVIAIIRGNKAFIPTLGTEFRENDYLHLVVANSSDNRLKTLLGLA
jgi:trk system potassium uptake protein